MNTKLGRDKYRIKKNPLTGKYNILKGDTALHVLGVFLVWDTPGEAYQWLKDALAKEDIDISRIDTEFEL